MKEDEIGQIDLNDNYNDNEGDVIVYGDDIKVLTSFISLEGIDVANVNNQMMSHSENTNDLTYEL